MLCVRAHETSGRLGACLALLGILTVVGKPALAQRPPKDPNVVVLFSGKESEIAENWIFAGSKKPAEWKFVDGAIQSMKDSIVSKQTFQDFELHVEFKVPYMPKAHGQERGNSGVGLQARYEIQVLDSFGIADPGSGDCGAVYSQAAPLVNACKAPLKWQTYDIIFRAPRFDADGKKTANARVTVRQNGIIVQNNQEITGPTGINDGREPKEPGPILLQYHNNSVQFRNVWVLPLKPHGALHY